MAAAFQVLDPWILLGQTDAFGECSTRTMPPNLKKFLQSWLINTLAVLVAVYVVPGLRFKDNNLWTPCVTSLILGILNAFIRPIMDFLALPLLIVTLGLFRLVINAFLLYLVSLLLSSYFEVRSFWSAFLGALVISVIALILNTVTRTGNSRLVIQRRRRPPGSDGDGGGPVIDV
jgi:putative membrane protein